VGFVVEKVALGQVFSDYFGFPCKFSFHQLLHNHHHLSSGAGTRGELVAAVPNVLKKLMRRRRRRRRRHVPLNVWYTSTILQRLTPLNLMLFKPRIN
jgi:hypothetical protein